MLTEVPPSNHASEDIHEQSDRDEPLLEADVGDIAYPDLITSTDLKGLQVIPPSLDAFSGAGGLTRPFDSNTEVDFFHQASNAFIPNGMSLIHQQFGDTSIPVCRIRRR